MFFSCISVSCRIVYWIVDGVNQHFAWPLGRVSKSIRVASSLHHLHRSFRYGPGRDRAPPFSPRWRAVNLGYSAQTPRIRNVTRGCFFVDLISTRLFREDCSRRLRITGRIGVAAIDGATARVSDFALWHDSPSAPHQMHTKQTHCPVLTAPQTSAVYFSFLQRSGNQPSMAILMMRSRGSK